MAEDMEAVVERLETRATRATEFSSVLVGREIYVPLTDLRAILAERRKMVEALEPFALLAASEDSEGVNMNDPLSKWLTIAQLQAAHAALTGSGAKGLAHVLCIEADEVDDEDSDHAR